MSVSVDEFFEAGRETLQMEYEVGTASSLRRVIHERAINRPGLALSGYMRYFANRRIQVLGLAEFAYLSSLDEAAQEACLEQICKKHIPCIVLTRNRKATKALMRVAKHHKIPVLRSALITSDFINEATLIMEELSAPHMRFQGTMIDILGIGVIIEGPAGVGKSEAALGLISRGHSLVSDDVTILKRTGSGTLVGHAPEITRYHLEIRGLGIVHVPSLFGVGAIRREMNLDLLVSLHHWDPRVEDDRTGLAGNNREVMGVSIPIIALPVAAGRDVAHVIEVAALNHKLKILGHDAAKELDAKLVSRLMGRTHSPLVE
ncbi:MAG: HPr(Ser) kinase/phosphatase [Spartobacteria bacterium]|nr:HPr(Ser) kinase/phosphatase [Spartobacteria bacterium]